VEAITLYYVSGSHRESEGHRDRADGQVDAAYAQLGFRPAEHWDLSFKYNHTEGWACDPEALGQAPWPRAEKYIVHDDVWWTTLTHKYEHFEGYIKVYYDNGEGFWEEWDNAFPPPVNTARNSISAFDNYGLRVRETFRPWATPFICPTIRAWNSSPLLRTLQTAGTNTVRITPCRARRGVSG